ncbi:MAG: nucleotidyltransferase domain-containing protein [Verrucomicrobia bacterium]|nr:nucleotidyltransferase domain-containing protein [Verrucomicrobiota bacterium]
MKTAMNPNETAMLTMLVGRLRAMGATEVLLYGSAARRELEAGSDIDLLVVFPIVTWELEKRVGELCFEAGLECDRVFSTLCFSEDEIKRSPLRFSPVVLNARREGMVL